VQTGAPVEADTLWRIYSMTKPITSVAAMMLWEEGHFELTDEISKWLPAFADVRVYDKGSLLRPYTVPAIEPIRVWHLLTHTSGLTYGFFQESVVDGLYRAAGFELDPENPLDLAASCDAWAKLPLLFQPGSKWGYGVSTDVLGRLVEVISGQPFHEFLAARVLGPLGMADTGFSVAPDKLHRFAANYVRHPKTGALMQFDDPATSRFTTHPAVCSGGGGLTSTAADYLRFCAMMLNEGELDGARLLGRKTVELMTMNHLDGDMAAMGMPRFSESNYAGIGFGLGFSVTLDPARAQIMGSPGEYAWGGAASTAFWCDPAEDMAVVLLTQLMPSSTWPIRRELRVLTYQAIID
jgi:CubicO group peptidase (beta-lactamase class C family)